ncbi:histone H3-lysine(4) N-trimethyltransferase ATX1 isoform X1 [Rhododendron vialii]|uniref:histone H3-lysine(4) N-trimethyltransferase ATX1 isoform X1 n=1 Tax=Rhododendron vialii TaxID=182163 RepID=UPI00265D8472|nr:histone H3-lysine(4) N-trimethyltransferase ATX1 isoform X1 [Rhododendron vialii]
MALSPRTVKPNYSNINHTKTGEEEDGEAERSLQEQQGEEEIGPGGSPKRYVPLCDLYSATSPCVNGGIMSKKVKARKMTTTLKTETLTQPNHHLDNGHEEDLGHASSEPKPLPRPPVIRVYTRQRRPKKPRPSPDSLVVVKVELEEEEADTSAQPKKKQKKSNEKKGKQKALVDSTGEKSKNNCVSLRTRKSGPSGNLPNLDRSRMVNSAAKRWVRLGFDGADSNNFIGLQCKVYWPLDDDWYTGRVVRYNAETGRHHVSYEDGDEEDVNIRSERIKFYISRDEMRRLNLSYKIGTSDTDGLEFSEMVVLAASFDDCHELGLGDIIWAKIAGHAMWPAVVVDESCLGNRKGLTKNSEGKSVPVQFFGSHDFARVNTKQIISFLKGLLSSFHLKCKKPNFVQSLEEAKLYLSELKLPRRMIRMQNGMEADNCDSASQEDEHNADSGEECKMELSNSKPISKPSSSKVASQRSQDLPIGYRPVLVKWKDLDKCNVCDMDEEYENNLFLQCDKCRMMVHAKCYGELEPVDGVLWLCNLCRPGAPNIPPPCCLCPLIGGAMKPTTDGRWAHLACAIWIPETCLSDIKKMEPIDGLNRINKDRWKLLCSICGVSYGACIQCSNNTCRVAYHPLCARAAGFCAELEDEDRLHLISMDEDEDEQCIRLLSFCKKHRPPSTERLEKDDRVRQTARQCPDYSPPSNPSGCARSEPYNYFGRRGRKEPEALAAASLKRLFVENRPYLVGGCCQHEALGYTVSSTTGLAGSKFSFSLQKLKSSQLDAPKTIHSMAEKYKYMRETFRKRLAFGKSGIHGFGIFAKQLLRAGDMVIEYTGELVRPPIADRREHLIYNSLVGAGTYLFRIDDERVIDATRAGSIAHLINHSCEPNCYSRVISVNGDEHIIIFAKRDIKQWEELTYDYRFFSIDEQLACYCGFPRCRGVVNDIDAEEQLAKLYVSRSELRDWRGE